MDKLEQKVNKLDLGQTEMKEKLNKMDDAIDLIANKQWKNERDIYTLKKLVSLD